MKARYITVFFTFKIEVDLRDSTFWP